ncbi:hypothetical protein EON67_00960 [archaeon]|nr:MAG: hypothetical protein EON67_00960 [archaeon]
MQPRPPEPAVSAVFSGDCVDGGHVRTLRVSSPAQPSVQHLRIRFYCLPSCCLRRPPANAASCVPVSSTCARLRVNVNVCFVHQGECIQTQRAPHHTRAMPQQRGKYTRTRIHIHTAQYDAAYMTLASTRKATTIGAYQEKGHVGQHN